MKTSKRYGKKGPSQVFDYYATEDTTLLPLLIKVMPERSRTDVKSLLAHNHVTVNDRTTTQFDTPITPKDKVSINFTRPFATLRDHQLHILFEDEYLIAVEKASGLLSVGREGREEKTAWSLLTNYVKQKDARETVYVCHRLDQYTSGILVFAKNEIVWRELRNNWDRYVRQRSYTTVVEGTPQPAQNELRHLLTDGTGMRVRTTTNEKEGRLAVTRYRTLQTNEHYSLLDVEILTGRRNQIRVQLAEVGYPVAGDRKYGAQSNPADRLMLHNYRLVLAHPVTHEELRFEIPTPPVFRKVTAQTPRD